mgnify:CR=1 FL=1
MNGNVVMKAKDTVFAGLAECFVTIGTRRYNFMQAINLEAKFEKNKTEVPILGKTGKGNKASGWKGDVPLQHIGLPADDAPVQGDGGRCLFRDSDLQ